MCDNLPFNFDISDILMVVYNLILSIRSTLFNYKQFVLHLNIGKFLKDSNSIKCCCNKYDHSFIIITVMLYQGTSILLIIRDFVNSYPKIESIANQKNCFEKARHEMQNGIYQFTGRISNEKVIHENHLSE